MSGAATEVRILFRTVLDAIEAHTALLSAGARHRAAAEVPAILHSDHYEALQRVICDVAAVVSLRLADAGMGCRSNGNDFITLPLAAGSPLAADPEGTRELATQVIIWLTLHNAYSAAGIVTDYRARAEALLDLHARPARTPARLTPW